MWSKTRQVLESRLADDLKGRVFYHYDVYQDPAPRGNTEPCHVIFHVQKGFL